MFLAFAILALAGAFSLLLQRNLVLAGFSMALSLLGVAGLYLCLAHPAAAAFQVIVYAGAIVVLILFVVMMLNRHAEEPAERSRPVQRWGSLLLVLGLGAGSAAAVLHSRAADAHQQAPAGEHDKEDRLQSEAMWAHRRAYATHLETAESLRKLARIGHTTNAHRTPNPEAA